MPRDRLKRHVGFARVHLGRQGSVEDTTLRQDLHRILDPSSKIKRYSRVWRVSRLEEKGDFLCARMGFSKSRLAEETFYDEQAADFVTLEHDSHEGSVSCFVLYLPPDKPDEAVLAFEEQPPDIRRQSFMGAFAKFLADAHSGYAVESIRREVDFIAWLDQMERITEFTGTFRRPNPRWRPRTEQVEEIITSTHAYKMKLTAEVEDGQDSLDIAETILGGIVEHSKYGYGDYSAKGAVSGSEFDYRHGAAEHIHQIYEEASDTAEDIFDKLAAVVRENLKDLL